MTRAYRVLFISVAALCTACANQAPVYGGFSNATATNNSSSTGSGSTGTTITNGGSTGTTTTTTTGTGTEPLISMQISAVGYTSKTITVTTGTILNMTFTPGTNSTNISGTGVDPQYSQLGVYITVNGSTQNTGMLSNGLYGGGAQTSPVLSFGGNLPTCTGSTGSTCRQTVTITIDHPNDDYFCLNYGEYCPWAQMYYDHPWNGTLQIQTDDTVGL